MPSTSIGRQLTAWLDRVLPGKQSPLTASTSLSLLLATWLVLLEVSLLTDLAAVLHGPASATAEQSLVLKAPVSTARATHVSRVHPLRHRPFVSNQAEGRRRVDEPAAGEKPVISVAVARQLLEAREIVRNAFLVPVRSVAESHLDLSECIALEVGRAVLGDHKLLEVAGDLAAKCHCTDAKENKIVDL